ncbi:MAG: NAD(P)H-binding protein [Bauldia sp.]|nr:NAD(P)H-binding protein [Bauldia sp.]
MPASPVLLVTGASGHLGRQVVERLLDNKSGRVIAGTRDLAKVADLVDRGAEARVVDFDRPETLAAAFAGVDRLLLISTDALAVRKRQQRAAVEAAAKAGVGHIVYTSALNPQPSETNPVTDSHYWTEHAIAATAAGFTILRNNIYADMILVALANALKSGQMFSATGTAGRNYVTREDCAAVAAAALADAFSGRRILEVNGPAPVTQDEVAAWAGAIAGKPVAHVPIPAEAMRQGLAAAGLPDVYAEALTAFDVDAARGYHAVTTPVVHDLTGRAPTSVQDFLAANAEAIRAMA